MLTLNDAFRKFKSRLELTTTEQNDASRKQKRARENMDTHYNIAADFLSGSYSRDTKTKPLKDVDIFCVLAESEAHWKQKDGIELLENVAETMKPIYGVANVAVGRRAVQISFDTEESSEIDEDKDVLSIDIIPGFPIPEGYLIPCKTGKWVKTNPKTHKTKATDANAAFNLEWKPMVKMLKKWNEFQGKPVRPSFLIEVMALDLLRPPFSGGYITELKFFFANAAEKIHLAWPDPAGLGPSVGQMTDDELRVAKQKLKTAEQYINKADLLYKQGKSSEALRTLREDVFGPRFPIS